MRLIKTLNILIILSLTFVIYQSIQYYKCLNSIVCIGLQAPPEYYVLKHLIPYVGILSLIPILLLILRYFFVKRSQEI
jgi:hypothetical protein